MTRFGSRSAAVGPYPGASATGRGQTPADGQHVSHPGQRRLHIAALDSFEKRVKPLPLDANTKAAPNLCLLQLEEHVYFACSKCRKDGISSDCVAVDTVRKIIMCTRCAARVLRPKEYRPSRVVPFPSLLSWLNYKPAKAMSGVESDVGLRAAEAVAPTGHRVATTMLGGGPSLIRALPATPMQVAGDRLSLGDGDGDAMGRGRAVHPCLRVWGRCAHGETCLFRDAPPQLCLAFLVGLCDGDERKCSLLHQQVYGLPPPTELRPSKWLEGDLADSGSAIAGWIARGRRSTNRAEWQLWNNGEEGCMTLLRAYFPPDETEKEPLDALAEPSAVVLSAGDIASALDFI